MNKDVCMLLLGGMLMLWSCKGTKTSTQKVIQKDFIQKNNNASVIQKFVPSNSKLLFEDPKVIEKIQVILYLNNYQTGRINGEMNAETLRALVSFQKTNNIQVGDRSSKTLNALGINEMDFNVMGLQENLERKGYTPGVVDGILGPKTRTAYQTFLRENKFNEVGFSQRIKEKLLEIIAESQEVAAPKPPITTTSEPANTPKPNINKREQVKKVQEALRRKGYDPGEVDSVFSLQTKDALFKYQVAEKLPIGGFNPDTLKSLGL